MAVAPPELPDDLPVSDIAASTVLCRAHDRSFGALYFAPHPGDPPTHRFHSPNGSFATCFLGLSDDSASRDPRGGVTLVRGTRHRQERVQDQALSRLNAHEHE
jgi:hypothetical protein